VKSLQRAQFFEAVDTLVTTIGWRLDEQSLQPALTLEQLLLSATTASASSTSSVDDDLLKSVVTYHPHLNLRQLKNDLMQLKTQNISGTIAAIIAWFQEFDIREATYRSIYEAVATFLVLPTTTASCERSFSGLRRVKTYLRSTMGQERLNSMILSSAHLDILDRISICSVANDFANVNNVRKHHYGTFE
jgi:hypothetical protein